MARRIQKTARLTKKRAKELLVKIFGKSPTPVIEESVDHIPEAWTARMGSMKLEVEKINNGKTISVFIQFECGNEIKWLYFDADTLEYDIDFARRRRQETERSRAFDYMADCGYAVVKLEDAFRHRLETVPE